MRQFIINNPLLYGVIALVVCVGISIAASYLVVYSIIGANHQNGAAFEQKCVEAKGTLFETRQSGLCYDQDGKILFSTGSGGFTNFH